MYLVTSILARVEGLDEPFNLYSVSNSINVDVEYTLYDVDTNETKVVYDDDIWNYTNVLMGYSNNFISVITLNEYRLSECLELVHIKYIDYPIYDSPYRNISFNDNDYIMATVDCDNITNIMGYIMRAYKDKSNLLTIYENALTIRVNKGMYATVDLTFQILDSGKFAKLVLMG